MTTSVGSLQNFWFFCQLNGATFFTSGEQGSTVTHNESIIPGKHKTKARLSAPKGNPSSPVLLQLSPQYIQLMYKES